MGAYLNSLVRQDDLRARMQRDADTMVRAGIDTQARTHRIAAIIAAVRPAEPTP
jgi:hypothetical protein